MFALIVSITLIPFVVITLRQGYMFCHFSFLRFICIVIVKQFSQIGLGATNRKCEIGCLRLSKNNFVIFFKSRFQTRFKRKTLKNATSQFKHFRNRSKKLTLYVTAYCLHFVFGQVNKVNGWTKIRQAIYCVYWNFSPKNYRNEKKQRKIKNLLNLVLKKTC